MAWICIDLDNTLVTEDEMTQQPMPVEGAVEAMMTLANEGHRLTVITSRFAPAPDQARFRLKQEIESELASLGFPEMEVWTGRDKPAADVFIGDTFVTFDQDWGLALAQTEQMLQDRGLEAPAPNVDDQSTMPGAEDQDQTPPEEGQEEVS